jgi:hypothetical protein
MATTQSRTTKPVFELYDNVLEAMPIDPDGILAFRLPSRLQKRLSKLTAQNSSGKLTVDEQLELQKFVALEATMRALKAKALRFRNH